MYNKLNKNALIAMYITNTLITLIVIIIIVTGYIFTKEYIPTNLTNLYNIILIILLVINILNIIITPIFRYKRYKYLINQDKIDVIEGFLFQKRTIVPIERIHHLNMSKGPIDNILKLANIEVVTGGGTVKIAFLEIKEAEDILEKLKDKVNQKVIEKGAL